MDSITGPAPDRKWHPQSTLLTPADELMGIVSTRRADGSVDARMSPLARCVDDSGDIAAGALFVLADVVLGQASVSRLPSDRSIATTNLHLDVVARPTLTGGDISGTGRVDAVDEFGVMSSGELVDQAGRLIAVITGRFAVVAVGSRNEGTLPATPDRAAPRSAGAADGVPVHELLGLKPLDKEGPVLRFQIDARPEFGNGRGGIHGGIGALIGEQAAGHALRNMLPSGSRMRPVEIRACFLRPLEAGGPPVGCTAEVLHTGRRLAATSARVLTPDGRPAVLVDVLHVPAH
ncbi:PaaI family thioesterase [Streptomyces sp. GQFP]|uniref:PaaI family thioesterase n=1 Tax=Streptomyces sp. GQFP TaxID=2907545 RepID=UPI001F1CCDCB|nr:hotdog fold thioesterase [Streptomyces sp. GQFP]UIX29177.1 hotdog fold thioesterase [Streptomyces sp. GQFP]